MNMVNLMNTTDAELDAIFAEREPTATDVVETLGSTREVILNWLVTVAAADNAFTRDCRMTERLLAMTIDRLADSMPADGPVDEDARLHAIGERDELSESELATIFPR